MTISVVDAKKSRLGKRLYKVTCQLKDEDFDFEYWNNNNAHSSNVFIKLVNNMGYYTQRFGAFVNFKFRFRVSYDYWYKG